MPNILFGMLEPQEQVWIGLTRGEACELFSRLLEDRSADTPESRAVLEKLAHALARIELVPLVDA